MSQRGTMYVACLSDHVKLQATMSNATQPVCTIQTQSAQLYQAVDMLCMCWHTVAHTACPSTGMLVPQTAWSVLVLFLTGT